MMVAEARKPVATPQKQEFDLTGNGECLMSCSTCGKAFFPVTLDEAVKLADEHEQEKHAIFDLETS